MEPRTIETKAKTKEEAIEIALKELDVERGEVEIDVVSAGRPGILGIGSEPARVRVTLLEAPNDVVRATTEVLDSLVEKLGVSVVVSLKQAERPDLGGPVFEIEGEDAGLLIGRRGETLKSLQFLVKTIVGRRLQARANLLVDVEGYQERRYQTLKNMASKVAQRVAATGRAIPLEPMPPDERRIVHLAVVDNPDVTSESSGDGEGRKVVIHPAE